MKPFDAPVRRSVLITPGSRPQRIARATTSACDSVVIDLEDGVAPDAKPAARLAAAEALASLTFGGRERAVRVNGPDSEAIWHDFDALDVAHLAAQGGESRAGCAHRHFASTGSPSGAFH